jgi:hypothetical protein
MSSTTFAGYPCWKAIQIWSVWLATGMPPTELRPDQIGFLGALIHTKSYEEQEGIGEQADETEEKG